MGRGRKVTVSPIGPLLLAADRYAQARGLDRFKYQMSPERAARWEADLAESAQADEGKKEAREYLAIRQKFYAMIQKGSSRKPR